MQKSIAHLRIAYDCGNRYGCFEGHTSNPWLLAKGLQKEEWNDAEQKLERYYGQLECRQQLVRRRPPAAIK